jgi:hypothetical protein
MTHYHAEASRIVDASPDAVYAIIADYHEGHAAILPARYFTGMSVDEGGRGTGTVATVHMNVFGAKATYQMTVTEAKPGRLLVEEDEKAGVRTEFTLEPLDDGRRTRVTIATRARTAPGLKGVFEKWLNPAVTRKIYREELQQLAQLVVRPEAQKHGA